MLGQNMELTCQRISDLHSSTNELDDNIESIMDASFLFAMRRGRDRVQWLHQKMGDSLSKILLSNFDQFFKSLGFEEDFEEDDYVRKITLVDLTKGILKDWKILEDQQEGQLGENGVRSSYQEAVPSEWLLEDNWREQAFQELRTIRKLHSYLLDASFKDVCNKFELGRATRLMVLSHRKLLNFLASSSDDFGVLERYKCHKLFMSVKRFIAFSLRYHNQSDSLAQQTEVANRRDDMYNEIKSTRKEHSGKLDRAFKHLSKMGNLGELREVHASCRKFLEESLQFLASSRADFSIEGCEERLRDIEAFVGMKGGSAPADQYKRLLHAAGYSYEQQGMKNEFRSINWRDIAFEKLQWKREKFMFYLGDVCNDNRQVWYKIAGSSKLLHELDESMTKARELYHMGRARMSLFDCPQSYWSFVEDRKKFVYNIKDVVDTLQASLGMTHCAMLDPLKLLIPKPEVFPTL